MKKYLLLTALCSFATAAFAAIPVYEPFADSTAGGGTSYAVGATAWHQTNALGDPLDVIDSTGTSANTIYITNNSLSYPGLPASTGNSIVLRNVAGPGIRLPVGTAIPTANNDGAKVYYSLMLAVSNVANLSTTGDFCWGLNNGAQGDQTSQPSDLHARVYFKKSGAGYLLGLSKNGAVVTNFDTTVHSTSETVFIVVSYEVVTTNSSGATTTTNDNVRMWINPSSATFGAATPPTETLNVLGVDANETSITTLIFENKAATTPNLMVIDDVRLGTNWAFVTGAVGVKTPPPASTSVGFQSTLLLTNKATGASSLTYSWQFNGATIPGATTSVLSVPNMSDTNAGTYTSIVSATLGSPVTNTSVVTVTGDPAVTSGPTSTNVPTAGSTMLIVTAVGTPTLTYQWYENGNAITDGTSGSGTVFSGSQTATLSISSVAAGDNGSTFACAVTNGVNIGVVSTNATLTVQDPVILSGPNPATVTYLGTAHFTVVPAGTSPFTYQWFYNGSPLSDGPSPSGSGATITGSHLSTLNIANVTYLDSGSGYSVTVTNNLGSTVTSSSATLTVLDPYIVTQPTAQTNAAGTTATMSVTAAGSPTLSSTLSSTLSYQWYQNNNPLSDGNTVANGGTISGSSSASLSISGVADGNVGNYYVAVTGGSGSTTNSSTNSLLVVDPILITSSPTSLTERVGDHTAFTVVATGTSPGYQWSFAGNPIAGATKSSLTLTNIQTGSNGTYSVAVTNLFSTNTASATLTVINSATLTLASTNIIVARVGDGAQALSGATGNTLYFDQYTTNGTYVSTVQIPDEAVGSPYGTGSSASVFGSQALIVSGAGTNVMNEAMLNLSADNHQNLTFGGFCQQYPFSGADVTVGANAGPNWRGFGEVNAFGVYTLAYTNTGLFSGGGRVIHSVMTLDGTNFWVAGQASAGGLKFANTTVALYAAGNGIPTITSSGPGPRVVQIINGNLVFSDVAGASGAGIYACVGTPEPTTTTPASAIILAEGGQPNDFAFSPDGQTVYIADGGSFSGNFSQAGGIQRWDTNNVNGWSYSYTIAPLNGQTNGAQGLTVYFPPSITTWGSGVTGAVLFATSVGTNTNSLVQVIDTGSGSTTTVIATAGVNQALHGVRFGPTALPPVIATGPATQTNFVGNNVTLTVSATGSAPFFYQWSYNSVPIAGATQSSFTTNSVSTGSSGTYSVVVSNLTTQTASASAILTIIVGSPTFTTAVGSYTETVGDHLSFVGIVTGSTPFSYQWYKNSFSNPLPGQTNNYLSLTNIQTSDSGTYMLAVSNAFNTNVSSGTLTVTTGLQPLSAANLVVARIGDGVQPLSYATGNTLYLDQYTTAGGYVNTIQIPDEGAGQPYGTGSSASSNLPSGSQCLIVTGANQSGINDAPYAGLLTRSPNGQSLDLVGYVEAYPFSGADVSTGVAGTWRGIGEINGNGAYILTYTNTGIYNAGNHQIHSAVTLDQSNFWTTGEASSANGVKYSNLGTQTGGVISIAGSLAGSRLIQIQNNGIYFSDIGSNSTQSGIYLMRGFPTVAVTPVELINESNSPSDFAISPDAATIFVADNGTFAGTSSALGGIQRWDTNTSSGGYTLSYTLGTGTGSTAGARALTVDFSAHATWGAGVTGAKLYATTAELTGNRLLAITDTGASSSATVLATAGPTNMLGGVRFGPSVNAPSIVQQPRNQVLLPGMTSATFNVIAAGNGPLTYQWQTNGVAIAGATATIFTADLTQFPLTGYSVVVSGAAAPPATSSTVNVTFASAVTFNTNGAGWNKNGSLGTRLPLFFNNGTVSNEFELTQGINQQASSAFYNYLVYVGGFQATWTYQLLNPTSRDADGTVFAVQNDPRGASALGGSGGSLGYSGITPSVGLAINVYPGAATGVGLALETGGATGNYSSFSPVVLTNGNPINVSFQYVNGVATVSLLDTVTSDAFTNTYNIDIPGTLGTQFAYIGFTGADGGTPSTQIVSNFVFTSLIPLNAGNNGDGTLTLSWPTNVGGYTLQQTGQLAIQPWSNSPVSISVQNGSNEAVVPISSTNLFYRLHNSIP